ncbi:MAG TPA: hypothetical protein VFR50_14880 [Casimicrobiaceae bacterium]|nr:hypothetical protein [Casimicrobiaceae bacterium]
MKPHRMLAGAIAAALLALGATQPGFAADAHSHAGDAPAKLVLDHGRKWTTDAPLRQRMGEIRALMAANIESIHTGKLSAAEYAALGAAVEGKVAAIVAECKLPPEADAMLHLIVADLVAGADVMQGKVAGKPTDGVRKVVAAANAYGRYFDDAGWKPLA